VALDRQLPQTQNIQEQKSQTEEQRNCSECHVHDGPFATGITIGQAVKGDSACGNETNPAYHKWAHNSGILVTDRSWLNRI